MARRHMLTYGTTEHQLATAAAVIRTNGHHNPEAVYHGRGPFTADDVLASPLVAEPFHLLDCATTSEGGCALVLAGAERVTRPWQGRLDPRLRQRQLRPRVHRRTGVGLHPSARRGTGGAGGSPRSGGRLRHGGARTRGRRRGGALRPVLLRDHPPARGLRVLRARGGGADGRVGCDRARREPPGHHRRRHHVLQPPRDRGPAVPAGGPGCPPAPRGLPDGAGPGAEVALCSNGGPAPCSPTSWCWGAAGRERRPGADARRPADGHSRSRALRSLAALLGGMPAGSARAPAVLELRRACPAGVRCVRPLPPEDAGMGAEQGARIALQLDRGVAAAASDAGRALRPRGDHPRRGLVVLERGRRLHPGRPPRRG